MEMICAKIYTVAATSLLIRNFELKTVQLSGIDIGGGSAYHITKTKDQLCAADCGQWHPEIAWLK